MTEKKVDEAWKESMSKEQVRVDDTPQQPGNEAGEETQDPMFAALLSSLGVQALVSLGEMADSSGMRTPPNLELAQHVIETLAMLERKMKNNLSAHETQLLRGLLHDLHLKYVQHATPPQEPPAA